MTGRRPTRSDSAPSTGANTNCIAAHTVPNRPSAPAALASLPPSSWMTSLGNTGAMMPRASMSKSTVPKMNQKVARRTGGARLEPPDQPHDRGAATLLQVPLDARAQRLRLHVGMVVVHEVQHGAEHAIRALLVIAAELAGRHRSRHLVPAEGRRVPPQAPIAIGSKRRADARAQREHLGEIALHHAQGVRRLHVETFGLVFLRHGGARIERLARLQVLAVVPAMRAVHDQVLHEDSVDAGVLLHGARQAVAIVPR